MFPHWFFTGTHTLKSVVNSPHDFQAFIGNSKPEASLARAKVAPTGNSMN
jgi:hypothetical protein